MDEDYMCPNCVTPWKCNGPHLMGESVMEIGDDLPSGETEVSLELEEAMFCAKLGLEVVLYCNIYGVSTSEVKELIRERGEYLSQEPDPDGGTFTGLHLNSIPEPSQESVTKGLTGYDTSMKGEWWE